jgi:hypothetical protein
MATFRVRLVDSWSAAVQLAVIWSEQTGLRYRVRGTGQGWLVTRARNARFPEVCPTCHKRHTYRPARAAE